MGLNFRLRVLQAWDVVELWGAGCRVQVVVLVLQVRL